MCDAGVETIASSDRAATERPSAAEALRLSIAFLQIKDVIQRSEVVALAERYAEQN